MSIYLYDEALVKKLKYWTQLTDIHIYSPDDTQRLFEIIADDSGDAPIELPIICLRRKNDLDFTTPRKRPLSYNGMRLNSTVEKSSQLNAIPVTISYQLDIYTRYAEEADELIRNLTFNIINYPKLPITFTYNDETITHNGFIRMESSVVNNSDIPERLISGQFSRYTFNITIDDAYIFSVSVKDNAQVGFTLQAEP